MVTVTLGTAQTVGMGRGARGKRVIVTAEADLPERLLELVEVNLKRPMSVMTFFAAADGEMLVVLRSVASFACGDLKLCAALLRVSQVTILAGHSFSVLTTGLIQFF